MNTRTLIAIPVYNEEKYARKVLSRVLRFAGNVLIVDDGSTDRTPEIVSTFPVDVIRHCVNRGYGQSLIDAFRWADSEGYDWVVTMDCDEQHEPDAIPMFMDKIAQAEGGGPDIISGSRYLAAAPAEGAPPPDRRSINAAVTAELNARLGFSLTDSFCGFKAYRVAAVRRLTLAETGYAFPMQFWVQVAALGLKVEEVHVKLIYNDPNRSFGAVLDDPAVRLAHYRRVMHREICRLSDALPSVAARGLSVPCHAAR